MRPKPFWIRALRVTRNPRRHETIGEARRERMIKEAMRLPNTQAELKACPVQHFITLTTKEDLDFWQLSAALKHVLRIMNEKLFGKRRARKGFGLVTYVVQEVSYKQGRHIHMIVGEPEGCLTIKKHPCRIPVPTLIIDTWIKCGSSGARLAKAQDAQTVYYLDGVADYLTKRLKTLEDADNIDLDNTHFPTITR